MAKQTLNTLKNWFRTSLKPTQAQFWDWLDSFWHKDDKIPLDSLDGLQEELDKRRSTDTPIKIEEVSGLEDALANAGGGGSSIIENDIPVYGTSFGKYISGETIPAAGKTVEAVLLDVCMKAVNPTASLAITSGVPAYNSTNITNVLSFSHVINTPGATVATAILQFRRNNTGAWTTINEVLTTPDVFNHVNNDVVDKVTSFNYQYIVTDSNGSTVTATAQVTPAGYAAPTCSIPSVTTTREKGNISTALVGNINQTAQNGVRVLSYELQYKMDGGSWTQFSLVEFATAPTMPIAINTTHNNVALKDAVTLAYQLLITCETATGNVTTTLNLGTVTFSYYRYFGAVATLPTGADSTARRAAVIVYNPTLQAIQAGTFVMSTGNTQKNFFVCLPPGLQLISALDTTANATVSFSAAQDYVMKDAGGNDRTHKMYTVTLGQAFSSSHNWTITIGLV